MSEEKKEKWLNYMAITTVLVAVCATLSTFKGGGYGTKSLMSQSKASDRWSHFQSKSIKGYMFEQQKATLELEVEKLTYEKANIAIIDKYNSKLEECNKKIKKYETEKTDIMKEAKAFEDERDDCKKHSSSFGIAVIFLQISILLSSISALTKKKYVWILSIVIAVFGIFCFFNGFFIFILL